MININKYRYLISIISLIIGIFLLWDSVSTIIDYIKYPNRLRYIQIPNSLLFAKGIFGALFLLGGSFLIFKSNYYIIVYKLISYSLIIFGIRVLILGDIMTGYGFEFEWVYVI